MVQDAGKSLRSGYIIVYYKRGITKNLDNINIRTPSPYFDEIIVETSPGNAIPKDILYILELINQFLKPFTLGSVPPSEDGAVGLLQAELSALTKLHRNMMADAVKFRKDNEVELRARREELETETIQKIQSIELKAAQEESRISDSQEELDKARQTIDDRNHMHVRRALRENITSGITERIKTGIIEPKSAIQSYLILFLAFLSSGFAGFFAYESFDTFKTLATSDIKIIRDFNVGLQAEKNIDYLMWMFALRAVFGSFVCVSFLIFG